MSRVPHSSLIYPKVEAHASETSVCTAHYHNLDTFRY